MGVFKGDPVEFYQIYGQGEVPKGTPGAAFRFKINFVTKEGASYVAKCFSQGKMVYNRLHHLHEEYDLEKTVVKITRKGSTKDDTEYYVDPLPPNKQPTEAGWAVIDKVPLQDLGGSEPAVKVAEEPAFDDAPFPDKEHPDPYQDDELDNLPF